jgi:CRISPR-associated protein Csy1
MSEDQQATLEWADAFASVTSEKAGARSSYLARQVYFPINDAAYHLLAPLYPTSLMHHVFERINRDRFSEENKAARDAKMRSQWHPHGFRDYPYLAIQKYGGTKPQNISQLNSERRGEGFMLPSLPPVWQTPSVKPPLHADSVFPRIFGYRREVRKITDALSSFLEKVQDYNNIKVRRTRAEMVSQIIDSLVQYAARVQELEPGWSLDPDCQLSEEEQLWLDPGRADSDPDFSQKYIRGEWRTEVSERFARWLNRRIEGKRTPMGDPEFLKWRQEVEEWL